MGASRQIPRGTRGGIRGGNEIKCNNYLNAESANLARETGLNLSKLVKTP